MERAQGQLPRAAEAVGRQSSCFGPGRFSRSRAKRNPARSPRLIARGLRKPESLSLRVSAKAIVNCIIPMSIGRHVWVPVEGVLGRFPREAWKPPA